MKKLLLLCLVLLGGVMQMSAENMYIVGDAPFGGWKTNTGTLMTDNEDGTFTYEYTPTSNVTLWFCIASELQSGESDWSDFNAKSYRPTTKGTTFIQFESITLSSHDGDNSVGMAFKGGVTYTFKFTKSTTDLVVLSSETPTSNLYLRSNIDATASNSWKTWDGSFSDLADYKFTNHGWQTDSEKFLYTYNVTSSQLANMIACGSNDLYFRIQNDDNSMPQICPSQDPGFTFSFTDGKYTTGYDGYSDSPSTTGNERYFIVSHSEIKAAEYKIKVYVGWYNWGRSYNTSVEIVSMPATVSNLGFSTFSCDRALDLDYPSTGLTAYYASGISNGKVVLTKATGKVAASTGLLLAGTKGTVTTGTIPVVTTSEADAISPNLLKPSVTATEVAASTSGAYHYFLAGSNVDNVGFYNLASKQTSGAGKAYLETTTELATSGSYGARVAWTFEDTTTGIANVDVNSKFDANAPMYNLAGQRVSKSYKGVVIVNGKKMLNK